MNSIKRHKKIITLSLLLTMLLSSNLLPTLVLAQANSYSPSQEPEKEKNAFTKFIEKNKLLIQGAGLVALALLFEKITANKAEEELTPSPDMPGQETPEDKPQEPEAPIKESSLMGFYVNWDDGVNLSWDSFRDNATALGSLVPFWYSINASGEVLARHGGHLENVHQLAKEKGIPILPLLNNYSRNGEYLNTPTSRRNTAENILNLILTEDYDGINIDFEMLPPWQRDNYTEFIKELSRLLRPRGLQLTISVFPVIDVPWEMHNVFDYKALAPYIDHMAIMAYDHHWADGPAGPIAPLSWVEDNIKYALEHLPKEKILIGIANYGYDWPLGLSGSAISAKEAHKFAALNNIEIHWDPVSYAPYYKYYQNSLNRTVWFENSYSMEFKKALAEKYELAGMAVWRLGNEDHRFWQILQ